MVRNRARQKSLQCNQKAVCISTRPSSLRRTTWSIRDVPIGRGGGAERLEWAAAGLFAAMTALDPRDSGPPDGEAMPGECRSVLSRHEIGGAPAFRSQSWLTNRGVCHEKCEPRTESPSTAKCATAFGRLDVLSGKSGLIPETVSKPEDFEPLIPLTAISTLDALTMLGSFS
jgi:hypothetical protein